MSSEDLSALDAIAEAATKNHFHHRNMLMLEAVISAMLDVNTPEEAAEILREHADQLTEYL